MSELVTVSVSRDDSSVTATVTGEIDVSNSELVRAELEAALTPPKLTVDLSGIEYLDSAGIRAIFAVAESAQARAIQVTLVVADPSPIRRVLDIAGVGEVVLVVDRSAPKADVAAEPG